MNRPWQPQRQWQRTGGGNDRGAGKLNPRWLTALAAMTRAPLDYSADGWTDGRENWNTHTIGVLERMGLCLRQNSEARLTPRGRELFNEGYAA